jgi:prepilin-type N-terminal cleavage/methylation domain-containing protein
MNKLRFKTTEVTDQAGFSLLEVAIGMLILGLLLTPFLRQYNIEQKQKRIALTKERLNLVEQALVKYAIREGHYPIPSDPSIAPRTAGFGQSVALGGIGNCAGNDVDVCRTVGARPLPVDLNLDGVADLVDTTGDGFPDLAGMDLSYGPDVLGPDIDGDGFPDPDGIADPDGVQDTVLIGSIPFAELQILEKFIADPYGGRITYAVSEYMTDTVFVGPDDSGVIGIINTRAGLPSEASYTNAHFVVVSHGQDRKGTQSMDGGLVANCGAGHVDDENCDNDGVFTENASLSAGSLTSYERQQSLVVGANYFDDRLRATQTLRGGRWAQELGTDALRSNSTGNILIGTVALTDIPDSRITIADGDLLVEDLLLERLCDFRPNVTNNLIKLREDGTEILYDSDGDSLEDDSYQITRVDQCEDIHPSGGPPPSGTTLKEINTFTPSVIMGVVDVIDRGRAGGGIYCNVISANGNDYSDGMVSITGADENCGSNFFPVAYVPPTCVGAQRLRGINPDGSAFCELP